MKDSIKREQNEFTRYAERENLGRDAKGQVSDTSFRQISVDFTSKQSVAHEVARLHHRTQTDG